MNERHRRRAVSHPELKKFHILGRGKTHRLLVIESKGTISPQNGKS